MPKWGNRRQRIIKPGLAAETSKYPAGKLRAQAEAEAELRRGRPALVLSDLRLPSGDGFGVLRAAKAEDHAVPVIVMTAYGGVEDAVRAMKEGALDFLAKPVDPDHLRLIVSRALAERRLATENLLLKEERDDANRIPAVGRITEHEVRRPPA